MSLYMSLICHTHAKEWQFTASARHEHVDTAGQEGPKLMSVGTKPVLV